MKSIPKSKTNLILSTVIVLVIMTISVLAFNRLSPNTLTEFENAAEANSLPGIGAYNGSLKTKINNMYEHRGDKYKPRTRHLNKNGKAKYTNRLFLQTSPYLLQHAHNPVTWFSWGDEAFLLAKKLNRPVFLVE